jgi:hypothetical protein
MKKLTTDDLREKRSSFKKHSRTPQPSPLDRRAFFIKVPLITAFVLAAQTKPLFAESHEGEASGQGQPMGHEPG